MKAFKTRSTIILSVLLIASLVACSVPEDEPYYPGPLNDYQLLQEHLGMDWSALAFKLRYDFDAMERSYSLHDQHYIELPDSTTFFGREWSVITEYYGLDFTGEGANGYGSVRYAEYAEDYSTDMNAFSFVRYYEDQDSTARAQALERDLSAILADPDAELDDPVRISGALPEPFLNEFFCGAQAELVDSWLLADGMTVGLTTAVDAERSALIVYFTPGPALAADIQIRLHVAVEPEFSDILRELTGSPWQEAARTLNFPEADMTQGIESYEGNYVKIPVPIDYIGYEWTALLKLAGTAGKAPEQITEYLYAHRCTVDESAALENVQSIRDRLRAEYGRPSSGEASELQSLPLPAQQQTVLLDSWNTADGRCVTLSVHRGGDDHLYVLLSYSVGPSASEQLSAQDHIFVDAECRLTIAPDGNATVTSRYTGVSGSTEQVEVQTCIQKKVLGLFWVKAEIGQSGNTWSDASTDVCETFYHSVPLDSAGTYRAVAAFTFSGSIGRKDTVRCISTCTYG